MITTEKDLNERSGRPGGPKPTSPRIRLFRKTVLNEKTGCLEWIGSLDSRGYGQIGVGSSSDGTARLERTHRLAWILEVGEIPSGLCVLHKCDNPKCVNVDHLFLGTHADNVADRESKGRGGDHSGENNGQAKLTQKQVDEIRRKYVPRIVTAKCLASEFGVAEVTIRKILDNKLWKIA